jgi:hypothetical protein
MTTSTDAARIYQCDPIHLLTQPVRSAAAPSCTDAQQQTSSSAASRVDTAQAPEQRDFPQDLIKTPTAAWGNRAAWVNRLRVSTTETKRDVGGEERVW